MSASQRIIPMLAAAALGMVSGAYIFDPILRQYAQDTNGTFRPEELGAPATSTSASPSTSTPSSSSSASSSSSSSSSTGTGAGGKKESDLSPTFTSSGEKRDPPSGGVGSLPLQSTITSSLSQGGGGGIEDGASQSRAERQREMAVSNASARAVEALQSRAKKTGEGEVLPLATGAGVGR